MRSLLADMANDGASVPKLRDPRMAARDAVLEHLRSLCSTLRGSMLLAPDYGVDDATHTFHDYPRSAEEVCVAVESAIRRYEPRLAQVNVRHIPSDVLDLMLRFEIQAVLVHEGAIIPVRFVTTLHSDHVSVS